MALARVVMFEEVDDDRIAQLQKEIGEGERPEGLPATEMLLLHDPGASQAVAIVFFDNEDDYQQGHETLDSMDTSDTPGRRASVKKYNVAVRRTE